MKRRDAKGFLPILGSGELYVTGVKKKINGRPPTYRESYEAARDRLRAHIESVRQEVRELPPAMRLAEVVVPVRLYPEFLAKSYYPHALFALPYLADVGSRRWWTHPRPRKPGAQRGEQNESRELAKMIFARTTDAGLLHLQRELDKAESKVAQTFQDAIRRIEAIRSLSSEERLVGFDSWQSGSVEMVLHPFGQLESSACERLRDLLGQAGVSSDHIMVRPYPSGPTFVSVYMNRTGLDAVKDFNPLRTAHPIGIWEAPDLRSSPKVEGPLPPKGHVRSSIVVGVFDGGLDEANPLVKGHAKLSPTAVKLSPTDQLVAHGTAVTGAVLYGALNDYAPGVQLPVPSVSVEAFRTMPRARHDHGFYEAIDLIERVVPQRQDIKVWNLSFGPRMPILDDDITRFTYALDTLAYEHRALFVVAAGNDGTYPAPEDRIQPPSDVVNGLGVGASTIGNDGKVQRAFYSSKGLGREGCKLKPDITAFGGCDQRPIHVVGHEPGSKAMTMGTSFASPIVAGRAAELLGRCDRFSPLVARALLVHTAEHPLGKPDGELGHGAILQGVDDVLHCCSDKSVTIIYQSSIHPTKFAKLPIPLPNRPGFQGNVEIKWTVALLSKVDPGNVEDYTESCVEDTFYPNSSVFRFTAPGKGKRPHENLHLVDDASKISALVAQGWKVSSFPATESGNQYPTEKQRRDAYKWDTIVQRKKGKRYDSLSDPYLVLHGIGRNEAKSTTPLHYAAVVTVTIPKYPGNLYTEIRNSHVLLEPIRLKALSEILVPIS